jgi:hypothetical protein
MEVCSRDSSARIIITTKENKIGYASNGRNLDRETEIPAGARTLL